MFEVALHRRRLSDLGPFVQGENVDRLIEEVVPRIRRELAGSRIINVNSTASGGGVAEMLHVLLPLTLGAGVSTSWHVIEGDPAFFALTKRLHNRIYGHPGGKGELLDVERAFLTGVVGREASFLLDRATSGDVVILHDPQPAPLARLLAERGVPVVWRCHIGVDTHNEYTRAAWDFLRPLLEGYVQRYVFTRAEYAPDWIPSDRISVIKPSIDPLAPKNQDLARSDVLGALSGSGIVAGPGFGSASFVRSDGGSAQFDMRAEIVRSGPPPSPDVPLVVQVSRWDPLKDMASVMRSFVEYIAPRTDAHLVLVGPSTAAVSDDPEGQQILDEVTERWRVVTHEIRDRIHLVSLPMNDPQQNGALVNAVQRHSTVVTQKSLAEGFGLTVAEAMFKSRPVVASAVGGIADQIEDEVSGLLIPDPRDLGAFGEAVCRVLDEPGLGERLGRAAHTRAVAEFLPDTSLGRWSEVCLAALEQGNRA